VDTVGDTTWTWVWDDYDSSRRAFMAAAKRSGARHTSRTMPALTGPRGEPLSIDAAYLGADGARSALIVTSGVHGVEGPAGAAIQTAWLEQAARPSGNEIGVLLVHAVNPWGFAHRSRGTEDNVDLNRSFIDRTQSPPKNPDYAQVHNALCRADVDEPNLRAAREFIARYEAEHGAERTSSAIGKGQYDHPDGLYFGGLQTPWSVSALESLFEEVLDRSRLRAVAFVDLHTGRGAYGQPFFLCFDPPGSAEFDRAASWWGCKTLLDPDELGDKYSTAEPPPRTGLMFKGVRAMLSPARMAGAVVEFGTYDLWTMYEAELRDRWARFNGIPGVAVTEARRDHAFRAFTPDDDAWRAAVLEQGPPILDAALAGLRAQTG